MTVTDALTTQPHFQRWVPTRATGTKIILFAIIGYSVFGKSFAYIGAPSAGIFIGEVLLTYTLIFPPISALEKLFSLLLVGGRLAALSWSILVFVMYGIVMTVVGILIHGYSPVRVLQNCVFNIYPLFIIVGYVVGQFSSDLAIRVIHYIAWTGALYTVAYLIFLHNVSLTMPGADDVEVFGTPGGAIFVLVAWLAGYGKWHIPTLPLIISVVSLIGAQVRSTYLAISVVIIAAVMLNRGTGRLFTMGVLAVAALSLLIIFDVELPSLRGAGTVFSGQEIIGRTLAPIFPEIAAEYTTGVTAYAGTVWWRTRWWLEIWTTVNSDFASAFFGLGYGFPLSQLVDYIDPAEDIRTPHNILVYALAYGGWIGVAIFFWMLLAILRISWSAFRASGNPFALLLVLATFVRAVWGNLLEAPFGAIPFYLLLGLTLANSFTRTPERRRRASPSGAKPHTTSREAAVPDG